MDYAELSKWLTPIVVGILSAFLASWLALSKFKKEKVWDEKRAGYKTVIESIEELIFWSEQTRASHCCEPTVVGETKFDESIRNLSRFSAIGSLIFSPQFHSVLVNANTQIYRLMFEIDDESKPDTGSEQAMADWRFTMANELRKILEDSLPKLIKIANGDKP